MRWPAALIAAAGPGIGRGAIAGRLARGFRRLYPERELILRTEGRVRYLTLRRWMQVLFSLLLLGGGGWVTVTSVGYFFYEDILEQRGQELNRTQEAYQALLVEVDTARDSFVSISRSLDESQSRILSLAERNRELRSALDVARDESRAAEAAQARALAAREEKAREVVGLAGELARELATGEGLRADVDRLRTRLVQIAEQRGRAQARGAELSSEVEALKRELAALDASQKGVVYRLAENTSEAVAELERTLRMTGVDVEELLAAVRGTAGGQGGPFVPFDPAGAREAGLGENLALLDQHITRWERLQQLLRVLPLAPPLDDFYVSSGFGRRLDPINGRVGYHSGVDMVGRGRGNIYAPAPGRVVYVGWKGRYGKVIEIDHGAGLRTLYSHLRKIYVNNGQQVGYRDKIALMGNTGRSTGRHLHYEIHVGGKPQDPLKFFRAGKYVFKD